MVESVKKTCFTFSGLHRTLSFLNNNIFDNSLQILGRKALVYSGYSGYSNLSELKSRSKFEVTRLYSYKDTSCMLSGLIKWN